MADDVAPNGSANDAPLQLPNEHQLLATIEQLQSKKLEAENDCELFRDLYGKASAHAVEVTRENNELHERIALAESQLRDGLAMLRGTYEQRVQKLQAEADRWRVLCMVLMEKDRRTDDEVRRRAALEPELSEQNRVLREELEKLGRDYGDAQRLLGHLTEQDQKDLEMVGREDLPVAVSTPIPA
ncbi:hypothetical protein BKA93DRAFT_736477 [Sparassis latifolia]